MSVINPDTKRSIKIGSATFNKLMREGKLKSSDLKGAKKRSAKTSPKKKSVKKEPVTWILKLESEGTADFPAYSYYHHQENAFKDQSSPAGRSQNNLLFNCLIRFSTLTGLYETGQS